ncbi:MAG: hypothetical protein LIP28_09095 [Deltaproteobacteria bacterium]|nr:hypothetical protein [Deltaproteobacteria bacterium]
MKPVLMVSDDVTGCVDSGAIFLSGGCSVTVDVDPARRSAVPDNADVIAYNMSSRTLLGTEAKRTHYALASELGRYPRLAAMKKMDIGFRGNASYEIEGLLQGLGAPVCFLMVHAPWRDTYTLDGLQYYEGVLLERSIVAREDPLKRPSRSDVCGILGADTGLPVMGVGLEAVRGPGLADLVGRRIAEGGRILVFDAVTEDDGYRVVSALQPVWPDALWAGSGGLAWALAKHFFRQPSEPAWTESDPPPRCACFCASKISTTLNQIAVARDRLGLQVVDVRMGEILSRGDRFREEIRRVADACLGVSPREDFLVMPLVPDGLEDAGLPELILEALSVCAAEVCGLREFDRLVVIGGETSQAVFRALGVGTLRLQARPETGLGMGLIGDGPLAGKSFSIKGGVCGSPEALCKMLGKYAVMT